jgi:hypothetical protein
VRNLAISLIVSLAALASGCMSDSPRSSGGKTHTYDCSGAGKGWGDCTAKADAECGANNYTTVAQNGDAGASASSGKSEMKRSLVITCK